MSYEVCWWRELEDGIEFFNISNCPNSKKQLSHFRSTSIVDEVNHVEEYWNHLLSLKQNPCLQDSGKINCKQIRKCGPTISYKIFETNSSSDVK